MTQQLISTTPHNTGTGDPAFTAFEKCNSNFTDLYTGVGFTTFNAGNTGTAPVPNFTNGSVQAWTQNANVTWGVPLNVPSVGQQLTLIVTQDGSGGHSTAWNAIFKNIPKTPASSVANSKATYIFIWNGSYWSVPDNYVNTPFPYGAVGDGVTNDTAAVQAAVNAGYCLLPAGFTFLVTSTITLPSNATLVGEGTGLSIIKGSSVVGPVIMLGFTSNICANFQISGTSTIGLQCPNAGSLYDLDNIWVSGICSYVGFYFECFSSLLQNLSTYTVGPSSMGGSLTLSASPSGLTTQTITGANPGNGIFMMIFGDGEIRRVTITGSGATFPTAGSGGTATWTGTVSTASTTLYFGGGFFFGGNFNANTCNEFLTQGNAMPFGFILDDSNAHGTSIACVFNGMIAQFNQVGVFLGKAHSSHTINSLYSENVVMPIVLGNFAASIRTYGHTINSPLLSTVLNSHPQYANRVAQIDFNYANGCTVTSPDFFGGGLSVDSSYAKLVFTTSGSTKSAVAYLISNAAGVPKAVALIFQGVGYTSNPTVTFGGSPTQGSGTTVTAVQSGGVITTLTLSGPGSGWTGAFAVPVIYTTSVGNKIINPILGSIFSVTFPLYPLIAKSSTATSGSGITVVGDNAWVSDYSSAGFNDAAPDVTVALAAVQGTNSVTHIAYMVSSGSSGTTPTFLTLPNSAGTTAFTPFVVP